MKLTRKIDYSYTLLRVLSYAMDLHWSFKEKNDKNDSEKEAKVKFFSQIRTKFLNIAPEI